MKPTTSCTGLDANSLKIGTFFVSFKKVLSMFGMNWIVIPTLISKIEKNNFKMSISKTNDTVYSSVN